MFLRHGGPLDRLDHCRNELVAAIVVGFAQTNSEIRLTQAVVAVALRQVRWLYVRICNPKRVGVPREPEPPLNATLWVAKCLARFENSQQQVADADEVEGAT